MASIDQNEVPSGCIMLDDGTVKCPDTTASVVCKDSWQLTDSIDNCYQQTAIEEPILIAGANVHVYKLLGVHEQIKLIDLTGNGTPISGGSHVNFPVENAFTMLCSAWRSSQKGSKVTTSAYIGYDFGVIKLPNGRQRHGEGKNVTVDVATLKIKQGSKEQNRATKIRVERSDDGVKWYGVEIVELQNNDELQTINIRKSVPSRYWRIRPIMFNGGTSDFWSVLALQMFEQEATRLDNIQDRVFLENRNRDYSDEMLTVKAYYDLINTTTELSRFGIELPSQSFDLEVPFNHCVSILGRPFVIGDIIELPSETQFSASLDPVKKYLEVVDVGWSAQGYTSGWKPTILSVVAQPMIASQETQDIVGDFVESKIGSDLFTPNDGNDSIYQDYSEIAPTIKALSKQEGRTPQRGEDTGNQTRAFTDDELETADNIGINIAKLSYNPNGLYIEDAVPPNGLPFTMGDTYPENPNDGVYHRLTYSGLAQDVPARLYRYSSAKSQWIYLETDRRAQYDGTKPRMKEYINRDEQ